MQKFSERLVQALEKRDITAAELARKIGVNEGTISNYKSERYAPKQKRIEEIANVLNVSIAWLMGADVPMTAEKKSDELSETKLALIDAVKQMSDEQAEAFLKFLETR